MKSTTTSRFALALMAIALLLGISLSTTAVQAQDMTDEQALERARADLIQLLSGDVEPLYAQLNAQMQAALTAEALAQGMSTLSQQVGAYQSELVSNVQTVQGYKSVTLTLQFEGAVLDFNISYDSDGLIAGLFMRPSDYLPPGADVTAEYVDPSAFTETDVTVHSEDGFDIACTLAMPTNTDQPVPALTIMSGSGPQDREGTLGPNKFYRDFAQGIASLGVAVLRCDDRTFTYGQDSIPEGENATVEHEFLRDARAAVALLQQTDGINPDKVFVLGHSEGAYLVPRLLDSDPSIAGGIMAAGTITESLTAAAVRQITYLINLDGTVTEAEQQVLDEAVAMDQAVQALTPESDPTSMIGPFPVAYLLDLASYDALAVAQAIPQPLLIIRGERDYQVDQAGFDAWQTALADRPDTTFTQYPGLNHLFMVGEGAPNGDEYALPNHVDAQVIADIAAWVLAH
ncbi:MAG: alpha/beta hydrolase [Anaerolineae bacterium]